MTSQHTVMSVVGQNNAGPITKSKRLLLEGYNGLRRRPWLFPIVIAGLFFAAGYILDPGRPLVDHGVFAGLFLIWGATGIALGILIYVIIKGLVLWSRYKEENY